MKMDKMREVFSDEEFVKGLFELETPEEVQAALEEKEIELSTGEICQMRDFLIRYQEGTLTEEEKKVVEFANEYRDGELSEEELENVSGGLIGWILVGLALFASVMALGVTSETRGQW